MPTHQFFLTCGRCWYTRCLKATASLVALTTVSKTAELIDVLGGHSPVLIFQNEKGRAEQGYRSRADQGAL